MEILVWLLVAGFLIFRLVHVLGQKTGYEKKRDLPGTIRDESWENDPENLSPSGPEEKIKNVTPEFSWAKPIQDQDKGFSPEVFIQGVQRVFERVMQAYADGDMETIRRWSSDSVSDLFQKNIQVRDEKKHHLKLGIVQFGLVEVQKAQIQGTQARIDVFISSDQRREYFDFDGNRISGDPKYTQKMNDVWVFEKDLGETDPTWKLVQIDDLDR